MWEIWLINIKFKILGFLNYKLDNLLIMLFDGSDKNSLIDIDLF